MCPLSKRTASSLVTDYNINQLGYFQRTQGICQIHLPVIDIIFDKFIFRHFSGPCCIHLDADVEESRSVFVLIYLV